MPDDEREVKIVSQDADGRRTVPVTGAHGGVSPDGRMIVTHLFADYVGVPSLTTHVLGSDGRVDPTKGGVIRRADIIREIQATLMLSPEAAQEIGEFLIAKAKEAQEIREQRKRSE